LHNIPNTTVNIFTTLSPSIFLSPDVGWPFYSLL